MSAVLQWGAQHDVAYGRSFALTLVIHALLLAVLFLGVRFQSSAPEAVSVELWEPPPPPPPKVEEPPPQPVPPRVEEAPKPEPKIEKPEIVEKAAPKPKPEVKPKPKAEVKPAAKPKPPPRDLELERRMREQLAQEQAAAEERQIRALAAREQAAARSRAVAGWSDKIRAKIRGNISSQAVEQVLGNPEALFEVTLLPTGEVLTVKMAQSSGNKIYDDAVERAILRSSPLPKPDQPNIFQRQLKLSFHPQDK